MPRVITQGIIRQEAQYLPETGVGAAVLCRLLVVLVLIWLGGKLCVTDVISSGCMTVLLVNV